MANDIFRIYRDSVSWNGRNFFPDSTKIYCGFELSSPVFPNSTRQHIAMHPAVAKRSLPTFTNQWINRNHQTGFNLTGDLEASSVKDWIIGCVLAAEFGDGHPGVEIAKNPDDAQRISGMGALWLPSQGTPLLVAQQTLGDEFLAHIEIAFDLDQSGFAVQLEPAPGSVANGNRPAGFKDPEFGFSPPDMLQAGSEFVPFGKAPARLVATYSPEMGRVICDYAAGRRVTMLAGGIDGAVTLHGIGICKKADASNCAPRTPAINVKPAAKARLEMAIKFNSTDCIL
jgi:hypothetical protein